MYREAVKHLISGWVLNGQDGVRVRAEGEEELVDSFILALTNNAPAASEVREIDIEDVPIEDLESFQIVYSDDSERGERTLVSPDIATCQDCERELFDPHNLRYHYPFINCTNCGPRYTIIDDLPYDREKTSMKDFKMCDECRNEYEDPINRRFHAQPNSCFECGPHIYFDDFGSGKIVGATLHESDEIIETVVDRLIEGQIIAIKGLGGFHLACDANNEKALSKLRVRKGRDNKAFAVMLSSIDDVKSLCEASEEEEAILVGSIKPIVLLKQKRETNLSQALVCGLPELGVMLPYTPLQMLIMKSFSTHYKENSTNVPMLVMTSANISDNPIVISDAQAKSTLCGIADAIVGNDREILTRFDDSVLRVLHIDGDESAIQMIRRARGYAPKPISLPSNMEGKPCLSVGAQQKNTFALTKGGEVFLSQHIGDIENAEIFEAWQDTRERMQHIFDISDNYDLACDNHPEYLTTKWAIKHASESVNNPKVVATQHHHAHIVAAMAENNISTPVIGFAFDGTGYGADGAIWGGEVLLSNLEAYERLANLAYMPMPGGASSIKNPMRMAYGLLYSCDLLEDELAKNFLDTLGQESALACESMIDGGVNTPYTSSMGRLFDAISALLGICTHATYEGEPAIALGSAIYDDSKFRAEENGQKGSAPKYEFDPRYEFLIEKNVATEHSSALDTSIFIIDPQKVVKAILEDLNERVDISIIARHFHEAVANCVVLISQIAYRMYGINDVALSGGVWMNRYLVERSARVLVESGFNVILNKELPPNDGCIAYGQAVIKCAQENNEIKSS